jgi:hypothetical protein
MEKWNANPSGFDSLSNFMGEIPNDCLLVLLTRNRDSDSLTRSNWDTVLKAMGGESDVVQIVRHGHWACGWIEYLMIDSRDLETLELAESIEKKLSDYPVFDEDHWSTLQFNEASEYYDSLPVSIRYRDYIEESELPCFAARHSLGTLLHLYDADDIYQMLTSN